MTKFSVSKVEIEGCVDVQVCSVLGKYCTNIWYKSIVRNYTFLSYSMKWYISMLFSKLTCPGSYVVLENEERIKRMIIDNNDNEKID